MGKQKERDREAKLAALRAQGLNIGNNTARPSAASQKAAKKKALKEKMKKLKAHLAEQDRLHLLQEQEAEKKNNAKKNQKQQNGKKQKQKKQKEEEEVKVDENAWDVSSDESEDDWNGKSTKKNGGGRGGKGKA